MEKRFKLVIIDNKSSAVLEEFDTDCIIAGISLGEDEAVSASVGHCNSKAVAKTIASTMIAIKKAIKNDPAAGLLAKLFMDTDAVVKSGGDDDE